MTYHLSVRSMRSLNRVHPDLVKCVEHAIQITSQDFGIPNQAVRTAEEQNALFKRGASQKDGYKNKSNHQITPDGYGHSVDLVPWLGGKFTWEPWDLFYPIAFAMAEAAREVNVRLRWGGNWYEVLNDYCHSADDARDAVDRYKRRHPGRDFIDGPHFELHGSNW